MPVWSARRGSSTNATPDQIPDSESSTEDYEEIVQVPQNNDACEFKYSSKVTPRLKENCVRMSTSGEPLVHHRSFLSVTEGYKLPFFAFPEPTAFKYNRSALEYAKIVENALEVLCQSGRVIRCANPPTSPQMLSTPFHYLCRPTIKRGQF